MKLYWENPNGDHPPPNASFFSLDFTLDAPPRPLFVHQIDHLPSIPFQLIAPKKTFLPSFDAWKVSIEKTIAKIREKAFEKVVLARKCSCKTNSPIDPWALLFLLKQRAQNSTLFCLEDEKGAFLGATPERLFWRKKNRIYVEALAGTSPRGKTPQEEQMLEQELLQNPLKQKEVLLVQSFLENTLQPFCQEPIIFAPLTIKKTTHVQHLHTIASALLHPGISDLTIAKALHPTPALCGLPQKEAFDWIVQEEPFQRGLYGGVLGYTTPEVSEWIVAIRSAYVRQNEIHLYSGCGIVDGAQPDLEWEELNHKLQLYW